MSIVEDLQKIAFGDVTDENKLGFKVGQSMECGENLMQHCCNSNSMILDQVCQLINVDCHMLFGSFMGERHFAHHPTLHRVKKVVKHCSREYVSTSEVATKLKFQEKKQSAQFE